MTLQARMLVFSAAWLAAAGCNSYDPNLADVPFRCGTSDPSCPDGYTCVEQSETERICVKDGTIPPDPVDGGPTAADASSFTCNNDSLLETNENITSATVIPIPALSDTYRLRNLAICPTTDVDVFRFENDRTGNNISIEIEFEASRGSLLLDILNSSGVAVRSGEAVDGNPSHIRAELPNAPAGIFHGQIRATPGVENNYSINFAVSSN